MTLYYNEAGVNLFQFIIAESSTCYFMFPNAIVEEFKVISCESVWLKIPSLFGG